MPTNLATVTPIWVSLQQLTASLLNTKQTDNISDKDKLIRFNQTDQVDCQMGGGMAWFGPIF
jgi:hypothetical protein